MAFYIFKITALMKLYCILMSFKHVKYKDLDFKK